MPAALSDIDLPETPAGSRGLTGVLGVPEGEGPWPAVVMVHEVYGINDVMRRQVERLTSAGYLVLMPDLFADGGARRCVTATFRAMRAGEGRAFVDLETARSWLAARRDCPGRVGILGFCMGGGFALAAASGRGFEVAAANYGMLPTSLDDDLRGACPIVASFGARDGSLRGAADRLDAALTRLDVPHDVKEYPAAGHAFMNDADSGPLAARLLFTRFLGLGPNPEAAADAWHRIETFFGAAIGPTSP